jgi:hypothetical protein
MGTCWRKAVEENLLNANENFTLGKQGGMIMAEQEGSSESSEGMSEEHFEHEFELDEEARERFMARVKEGSKVVRKHLIEFDKNGKWIRR